MRVINSIEEKNLYYYHPDHLGSSSYITDKEGNIVQHTEYIAFGEVLFDEHSVSNRQPYLFNGKELDFETGLYYYGARYYDPKVSIFLNVDPLAEKTGTPYAYTYNNPINLIDPDGREGTDWYQDKKGNYIYDPNLTKQNASQKLQKGEKYIGTSATILIKDRNRDVGQIKLHKDGNISASGNLYNKGKFKWESYGTQVGSVLILDAGLYKGNLVYGVDVESNNRNELLKNKQIEYNAKHVYDGNVEELTKSILWEMDKIDTDTEISIKSIEEGSVGEPATGNIFGGIMQKNISNRKKAELAEKMEEIKKLKKK